MSLLDDWVKNVHGSDEIDLPSVDSIRPYLDAQLAYNRPNIFTPFGSTTNKPARTKSFKDWKRARGHTGGRWKLSDAYKAYKGRRSQKGGRAFEFSPEAQSLFDKQFQPGAYDDYAEDYMGRYNELLAPGRDRQLDQFRQSMFDRGLPEGGDMYGDIYRQTVGDPNARQDLMAAQTAQSIADQRLMQDYNRLMAAMGASQLPVNPIDVMGPLNMAMNQNMFNNQQELQAKANFHKAVAEGIGAFFPGHSTSSPQGAGGGGGMYGNTGGGQGGGGQGMWYGNYGGR